MSPTEPHSAEYFGDQRDFWWNADFIELMAKRWRLGEARSVLEVGSGVGHWSRVLAPHLHPDATLIGLEREPRWVEEAQRRTPRFTYQQGDAMQLPFADATFDVVTCQTVLIHLPDVAAALREMTRVLKPGGLLAVAEPNNIGSALAPTATSNETDLGEALRLARLQAICERGKASLGLGFNSVGEQLPTLFRSAGLTAMQVYQSDHVTSLVPPYESPAEKAHVAQALQWAERDFYFWGADETRQYFLAGGGEAAEFERLYAEARMAGQRDALAMREGTAACAGGGLFYLISGRKVPGLVDAPHAA